MRVPALRKNVAFRAPWRPTDGTEKTDAKPRGHPGGTGFPAEYTVLPEKFSAVSPDQRKKRRHRILHKYHQTSIGKSGAFSWLGYLEIRDARENRAVPVSFRRCLPTCVDRRFRLF